jgi:DNA-binding transcriptional LysR family regulator
MALLRRVKNGRSANSFIAWSDESAYGGGVELRQLEAFVAVATELHFGRAAEKLHLGQPTVSDLVRRLERELRAALFTRTTRRVDLTAAGEELLARSKVILEEVAAATAAVHRITEGVGGVVRLGITPPVAPVLGPHLVEAFARQAPHVTVTVHRMWLPTLLRAVAAGDVDVAITCGLPDDTDGVTTVELGAEPLQIAVRSTHRFAARTSVALDELAFDVLGTTPDNLFPAWSLAQRQALQGAGVDPPSIDLVDTDLAANRWTEQADVDWIMLIASLNSGTRTDVVVDVRPEILVPFTLQWTPDRAANAAVANFVHCALNADQPPGWRAPDTTTRGPAPTQPPREQPASSRNTTPRHSF